MTRKIGIIGMGHVGSTAAHYIVACGFADDLVLIDKNEKRLMPMRLTLKMPCQICLTTLISQLTITRR